MATALLNINPTRHPKREDFEKMVEECLRRKGSWGLVENDILFALTIWLMGECGFTVVDGTSEDRKTVDKEVTLPENWKHGTKQLYEAQFILPPYDDHLVNLVALPADDILCINAFVSNLSPRNTYLKSVAVSSSGFVPRPDANQLLSKFSNLDYLRLHIRSAIIWPIRCSILTDEGVVNGSLSGLSDEIKLKILAFLEVRDLLSLSETCHDLHRVCNDQGLWRTIFHRTFRTYCKCMGKSNECEESSTPWKDNYKHFYKLRSAARSSPHSSVESFHTAADTSYYEVDLSYE